MEFRFFFLHSIHAKRKSIELLTVNLKIIYMAQCTCEALIFFYSFLFARKNFRFYQLISEILEKKKYTLAHGKNKQCPRFQGRGREREK